MKRNAWFGIIFSILLVFIPHAAAKALPASAIYYVSSTAGNDANNGLSSDAPFATLVHINALNLQAGDQVLLHCGDTWHAEQLIISKSGLVSAPITFGSYPAGCANKPSISGSQPITGWSLDSGNVYFATLSMGVFPLGINQLFRNGQRLTLGRWPNLNASNAGYSFIDTHSTGSSQFTDNELPTADWAGAVVHLKNIRWSMIDRQVTSSSAHTLTLNQGQAVQCLVSGWGSCAGWGYFINNSRYTLDQDGEWYYDDVSHRVYLYSISGMPTNIEGSVILESPTTTRKGGIQLSSGNDIAYVMIDNLEVKNWFNDGIGTPGGMNKDIYHHITVNNVIIKDVNGIGINLSSWLQQPSDGRLGLRGGHDLVFSNNLIDGANALGVSGYFASSLFENNTIQNIALIKNLGKSGMGCGTDTGECTENGDGFRIRLYDVRDSGFGNVLRYNRFDKIGYNGIDVFGPETTLEKNYITQTCFSKSDCGAVRVFGDTNLTDTPVYNIHILNNIIDNIPGNVDGCYATLPAFGMGLYIDNYSRNVEIRGNTVANTTVSGILYQQSSGQAIGNTVFNAASGTEYSGQIDLGGSVTQVALSGNTYFGLKNSAWTLYASSLSNIVSSDLNYYYQPYINKQIAYGPSWTSTTFVQWKTISGQDSHSKANWYTQSPGETSRARIIYNASQTPSTINLGPRKYLDLDQAIVPGSLTLQPYTSKILIDNGPIMASYIPIAIR
jgi:parallel beta-helix repeat protein